MFESKSVSRFFSRIPDGVIVGTIAFFALVARIKSIFLAGELWYDEVATAVIVHFPLTLDFHWFLLKESMNPPLYFIVLKLWSMIFGEGESVLRIFSSILSTIALYPIYFFGKEFGSRRLAVAITLTAAFIPTALHYGIEARMYGLLFLLCAGSIYFFFRTIRSIVEYRFSYFDSIVYFLFTLAALYTHLSAIGLVISQALFLFIRYRKREFLRLWVAFGLSCVLFVPWFYMFFIDKLYFIHRGLFAGAWYWNDIGSEPVLFSVPINFIFPLYPMALSILNLLSLFLVFVPIILSTVYTVRSVISKKLHIFSGAELPVSSYDMRLFFMLLFFVPLILSTLTVNSSVVRYYIPVMLSFCFLWADGVVLVAHWLRIHLPYRWFISFGAMIIFLFSILYYLNFFFFFSKETTWDNVADFVRQNKVDIVFVAPSDHTGLVIHRYLHGLSTIPLITPLVPLPDDKEVGDYSSYVLRYNWSWMVMPFGTQDDVANYKKAVLDSIPDSAKRLVYIHVNLLRPKELFARHVIEDAGFVCQRSVTAQMYSDTFELVVMEKGGPVPALPSGCVSSLGKMKL